MSFKVNSNFARYDVLSLVGNRILCLQQVVGMILRISATVQLVIDDFSQSKQFQHITWSNATIICLYGTQTIIQIGVVSIDGYYCTF